MNHEILAFTLPLAARKDSILVYVESISHVNFASDAMLPAVSLIQMYLKTPTTHTADCYYT